MNFDEKSFWKNIKSEDFLPVYLILGEEGYLKQNYVKLLCDACVPESFRTFNYNLLNGDQTDVDEIASCCENLPAMAQKRVVLVHDFSLDSLDDLSQSKMISLLSDPPPDTVLIFWQDCFGFSKKTNKAKEIFKLIENYGAVVTLNKRTNADIAKFIVKTASAQNTKISSQTASYLLSNVGDDMNFLENEIKKLCAFCNGVITERDIDEISNKTVEATAFSITDAILVKNFDLAYKYLDVLFMNKTEPLMICGAFISTYVDMYRAKVAENYPSGSNVIRKSFPDQYKSDSRLSRAAAKSKKYSKVQLRHALDLLSKTDASLKTFKSDEKYLFQKLIVELAMV